MQYLIIENGIVTKHCCGKSLPQGAIEVDDFLGVVGLPTSFYKADWSIKTELELIKDGLEPMPNGWEFNADETAIQPITPEPPVEPEPTEQDLLLRELSQLESWLRAHDYIGVKIATGRATVSDYATEIAEMTVKANRIDVIKNQLAIANGEIKINVAF